MPSRKKPPQNLTFTEEAAEETVATTLTSFPDTNETLRFDSEEVDGDAYDDAEESEPHLMFRKQEMYLPEEGNASSPEVQEPPKEGDKIEQVSSAVVFRNPDSSGPQVQRGPSQQATAVPFDLTSQPYGGYGLGYGRHYDSPPPPPPYGGQSPYGHGGYYEDRVSQTYADTRHGTPPHATQSFFARLERDSVRSHRRDRQAIEPGAERHRYENRRLERPDHRGSAGNEQKKELSGNRGLHYYEAAGHHREFNRTTDRVNASLWQTRSDLASGRDSQKPGLEADSTGRIRESVNGYGGPSSALREIVATTEKPYPEEVPLSLAIMVGEDSGGGGGKPHNSWARNAATNSGGGVYQPPRSRKREPPPPRPVEEEPACDPQNTIIITALVVSAIHVGLMLGGFFCFRWQRRSMKRKQLIASVMGDFRMPSGAGVTSAAMPVVRASTSAAAPGRSHYSPASPLAGARRTHGVRQGGHVLSPDVQ
ncbi:hypothetical protein MRX96_003558 [Rhipicephalus microplus]